MFTFFPILPTAAAAKSKMFRDTLTIEDALAQMKASHLPMRGQLIWRDPERKAVEYSHMYELKQLLDGLKGDYTGLQRIWIYHTGWWSCPPPPKNSTASK